MKQFSKDLGNVSLVPKGKWSREQEYERLALVYNACDNLSYVAKTNVPSGVDIENREYWQPMNVTGYADNNFINLTTENENGTITAFDSIEEAVSTIFPINRRAGATLSFFNLNTDRLDRQAEFELWQFNSTDLANWENKDYWNNIYYNWNVFAGWYVSANSLENHIKIPNVGQYAYVGTNLNDALLYQCRTNGTWTNTGIKVRNYISVVVSGNITIGENGNWFNDGNDTGIPATPAVDEQLDDIIIQLQQHTTEISNLKKSDANLQDQITSNDNDIATLNTKHESLSKTVQNIAVTGGASIATNVTYNNDSSGLNAENAQDAIDELQGSKIDKTSILQVLGKAKDKVMSQKAITDLSLLGNISLTIIDTNLYPLKDGFVDERLKFDSWNGCKLMTEGPSVKNGDIVLIYHRPYPNLTPASLLDKTTNEYSKLDFSIRSKIASNEFVLSFGMVNKDSTLILSSRNEDIEKIKYAIIETSSQNYYSILNQIVQVLGPLQYKMDLLGPLVFKKPDPSKRIDGYIRYNFNYDMWSDGNIYKDIEDVKEGDVIVVKNVYNDSLEPAALSSSDPNKFISLYPKSFKRFSTYSEIGYTVSIYLVPQDGKLCLSCIKGNEDDKLGYIIIKKEYNNVFGAILNEVNKINNTTNDISFAKLSYINGYLWKQDGNLLKDEAVKSVITDYFSVSENQKFKYIGHAAYETASVCYYNSGKEFISSEQFDKEAIITIPSGAAYARFASYSYVPVEPKLKLYSVGFGNVTNEAIKCSLEEEKVDVLANKIWVACGDSFTEGVEDYVFEDQPYKGEKKVYPFYIGRRNKQLTVINEAKSGSTISETKNKDLSFSYERYKNIRKDADYITLWFGINDSYAVKIGTIEDNTTATYYGAWNVVLSYLIENHPGAKIGIVISNAMNSSVAKEFALATINVAKKFGIPYLDLLSDDNIPYFLLQRGGTKEDAVSNIVKNMRNNYYAVSTSNEHPNYKAHLFESTIIENWLRSL